MFTLLIVMMTVIFLAGPVVSKNYYARIKMSSLVSDISGRLDNIIYSKWKAGVAYVKKMSTSVRNPNSISQEITRDTFSYFSKAWNDVLNAGERALWETWALTKPGYYDVPAGVRELVGSNGGIMSGLNAYCLCNVWLVTAGLDSVDTPPIGITDPVKPSTVAATSVAGVNTITWVDSLPIADAVCRIHVASQKGIFHKQIAAVADMSAETKAITAVNGANGTTLALTALAGEIIYIQCDCVAPKGGKSAGSNTVELLLTPTA